MTDPSAWFDPVTKRITENGDEITDEEWQAYDWIDVTTMAGYESGVHKYAKLWKKGEGP